MFAFVNELIQITIFIPIFKTDKCFERKLSQIIEFKNWVIF